MSDTNDSAVRWQDIRIKHLSYITNLILTLTVGSIAFWANFIKSLSDSQEFEILDKFCFWLGLVLLFISFTAAILLNLNRLKDFRLTFDITLKRDDENLKEEVDSKRDLSKDLGKKTYRYLNWQCWAFLVGSISMTCMFIHLFAAKLS